MPMLLYLSVSSDNNRPSPDGVLRLWEPDWSNVSPRLPEAKKESMLMVPQVWH